MNKKVRVTCYGVTQTYPNLEAAKEFYLDAIANTQGSEQDRYVMIYMQLEEGKLVCSDKY